ncbi:MAG: Uma2 family endonuclease [Chloroflexota bacterium]
MPRRIPLERARRCSGPHQEDQMAIDLDRYQFTTADYHRMTEAGILAEDDRVELIRGEILRMSPVGSRHASSVNELSAQFHEQLGRRVIVSVQNPVQLGSRDEPQPDVAILIARPGRYADALPTAADVLLLVEVADTSVGIDRGVKAPLYAASGIPELWIVDLNRGAVLAYTEPGASGYGSTRIYQRGETLSPLTFPDAMIAVSDVLGVVAEEP